MKIIAENINAVLVVAGFVSFGGGVAAQFGSAIAAIVGGVVVMALGSWPYVIRTLRRPR